MPIQGHELLPIQYGDNIFQFKVAPVLVFVVLRLIPVQGDNVLQFKVDPVLVYSAGKVDIRYHVV